MPPLVVLPRYGSTRKFTLLASVPLRPAPSGAKSSGPRRLFEPWEIGLATRNQPRQGAASGLHDHAECDTRQIPPPLGLDSKSLRILVVGQFEIALGSSLTDHPVTCGATPPKLRR